jgi:hypothetical protein
VVKKLLQVQYILYLNDFFVIRQIIFDSSVQEAYKAQSDVTQILMGPQKWSPPPFKSYRCTRIITANYMHIYYILPILLTVLHARGQNLAELPMSHLAVGIRHSLAILEGQNVAELPHDLNDSVQIFLGQRGTHAKPGP